jgi:hypothetical protein
MKLLYTTTTFFMIAFSVASHGSGEALNELGESFHFGNGNPQNYEVARKWYLRASQRGHPEAANHLGRLYLNGEGVPRNLPRACHWYRISAGRGSTAGRTNSRWCEGQGVSGPRVSLRNEIIGVGIALELDSNAFKITSLVPNGPAARSGLLLPGDQLLAVQQDPLGSGDGVPLEGLTLAEVVSMIRGPEGSLVGLLVARQAHPDFMVVLRREKLEVKTSSAPLDPAHPVARRRAS